MSSHELWVSRFRIFSKEIQKYLKYIFNGHFLFVMIFALGAMAYYYSEWVKTLDSSFPAEIILAAVLGLLITSSPIYTFLKDADMVFLLPLETKLGNYFSKSIAVSLVIQGYLILMVFAAFMPMYARVSGANFVNFILILIVMLGMKYVNLHIHWNVLRYQEISSVRIDSFIRFLINALGLYFLLLRTIWVFPVLILLLLFVLLFFYKRTVARRGLKWERLIDLEGKRLMAFYRIANLFTDVPKLKDKVARRKWLDPLLLFIPYSQKSSYQFLYARTLLRANDFVGLLIRLTIIGSFALAAFDNIWAKIIITLLFLYMTGLQLIPVWKTHEMKIWVSLYPLSAELRKKAVIQLICLFLLAEIAVFFIVAVLAGGVIQGAASVAAGIIFIYLFQTYAKNKIEKF
ncbi:ABC transporter permease [Peribacillus sp. SCS-155]|uniref:ABC transporter permease n=1 Tax=Peribacillus sedimenti TaxID=3115297 RepID=UPI003905EF10